MDDIEKIEIAWAACNGSNEDGFAPVVLKKQRNHKLN
jgi:hypothetical protein